MKSPLMYQQIEQSSGGITVLNCVSFLFDREEMPLEFFKIMASYSISCFDSEGNLTNSDFYDNLLLFASSWINKYAKEKHIPLSAKYLSGDNVNLLEIKKCLIAGGCVDLKTYRRGNHFVTITKMDDEFIYIFDPYFREDGAYKQDSGIEIISNKPFYYNRKVRIEKFISEQKTELVLGATRSREAVLFYRNDAVLQREFD